MKSRRDILKALGATMAASAAGFSVAARAATLRAFAEGTDADAPWCLLSPLEHGASVGKGWRLSQLDGVKNGASGGAGDICNVGTPETPAFPPGINPFLKMLGSWCILVLWKRHGRQRDLSLSRCVPVDSGGHQGALALLCQAFIAYGRMKPSYFGLI